MYNKQHLIAILWYIGIGFIGGSISHGFFSGTRSVIMAILWILLFIVSEYLKGGQKDYTHLIIWWLIYSVAVGMVNGWFQHFLDSPMRSLYIIPVGWILSTLIFPYKEWLTSYDLKKSWLISLAVSIGLAIILYASIHILPDDAFGVWWHHSEQTTTATTETVSNHH